MRRVIFGFVLVATILPLPAPAKQMIGTLHYGQIPIQFMLAGSELVILQQNSNGSSDRFMVPLRSLECVVVDANHTITIRSNGKQIQHIWATPTAPNVLASRKPRYRAYRTLTSMQRWMFLPDDAATAFTIASQINRASRCR